ncbi:phosphatidylglycerophosphatase A [Deferribacter abyssi]|uniref:phosphatidylglycerophosphatase A family protein n=1 Tax=Deferribacter abyssi TaxID=213806 RepID=UPI003C1FAEFD
MHKFLKWTATGLNVGFVEYMPGTFGTLVAVPLVLLTGVFSIFVKFIFFIILFITGIIASEYYQHYYDKEDPSEVVIDEIAAYYFIMIFFPITYMNLLLSFFVFRIFDIWKPYPIKIIEKSISGGVGIMIDDIIAALYTLIVMLLFKAFI